MTDPASGRRPWWKKKRWAAALALWLLLPVFYPLSLGVALVMFLRGWTTSTPTKPTASRGTR